MVEISLNASMRSNLLSLQQTQKLQDITQSRLSSGLKVNSAIDNPSSFYTASSLNNRAEDLGALLDAMSQSVQTIKAANEGLSTGLSFLQQAKATANQALEKTSPPKTTPDYSGPIAALVTNEAELIEAINTINPADGAIVLTNDIYMSLNTGLTLKNDMKLVGQKGSEKLNFNFDSPTKAIGIEMAKNTEISGLKINYSSVNKANNNDFHAIRNNGFNDVKISNVDITISCDDNNAMDMSAIRNAGSGRITLSGDINISIPSTTGKSIFGIFNNNLYSQIIQTSDSKLSINTAGEDCIGINAGINFFDGTVNITTSGFNSPAIGWGSSIISGTVNIITTGQNSHGFSVGTNHDIISSGTINITTSESGSRGLNGGKVDLGATSQLLVKTAKNNANAIVTELSYATGAKIGIESGRNLGGAGFWQATTDIIASSQSNIDSLNGLAGWNSLGAFPGIPAPAVARMLNIAVARNATGSVIASDAKQSVLSSANSYNSILEQYNQLINDSGYKGVNLLKEQDLNVNFNEDRSTGIEISGKDASTKGLGLTEAEWNGYEDIEKSIKQLDSAIAKIRALNTEFGNYYSVVNTREDFTANLINVLTEGSDKLTLADMNSESANMLALQTRQQLAINSLSLASQAAQSVLKLF